MTKRITTEEFIKRAKEKHGDTYGYSMVDYISGKVKVDILCKAHGLFTQTPENHLQNTGCPQCSKERSSVLRTKTTEQFIIAAKKVHSDKYSYANSIYRGNRIPIEITCDKHGAFLQTPVVHTSSKSGCQLCAEEKRTVSKTLSQEDFLKRAIEVHGSKYNYSECKYVGIFKAVNIICPLHGIFSQIPNNHINSGSGCPKCTGLNKKNTFSYITEAKGIHENKYEYSEVYYTNIKGKISIICRVHGTFEQEANNHLQGSGCPFCAREENSISKRAYSSKPATLYYIKIVKNNKTYYKIGVTSKEVYIRFKGEIKHGCNITLIASWKYEVGGDAYAREFEILRNYIKYLTKDRPLHHKGNTEVFDSDVLSLDPTPPPLL